MDIQSSRFGQFFRRAFSLKGGYAPNLLEDFFPTIEIAGDVMPDHRRSRGEHNVIISSNVAAVVGNPSGIAIGVPAAAVNQPPVNAIFVLVDLYIQLGAASNITFGIGNQTGLSFTVIGQRVDFRDPAIGAVVAPSITRAALTNALPPSRFVSTWSQPNNNFLFKGLNLVIPDVTSAGGANARAFQFSTESNNIQMTWIAVGYERNFEPSENIG